MVKLVLITFACILVLVTVESTAEKVCPDPLAIEPCTCEMENDDLFLDCSLVTSEEQLAEILGQPLPSYDFKMFSIFDNRNLSAIPAGTFGSLTFEEVQLKGGNIEVIEPGAFLGSVHTLKKLSIINHELSSFPFEEVELFRQLGSLKFDYNRLEELPALKSSTLYKLDLSRNPLRSVHEDVLQGLPSLTDVSFEACELTAVLPGTFTRLPKLNTVNLYSNNITHIPAGLMELHGTDSYVYMGINSVATIDVGAILGVSHFFDLDFNALTEVEEGVWRPMLERGTGIYLVGNPLACGSDIIWLIENPRFMSQLDPYAACANGTLLRDLQPPSFV